jgi:hypothetical protein
MLVEYIKDIIDDSRWDVELTDGKYIVKRIMDCKDNDFTYKLGEPATHWMAEQIKIQLRIYLPEDMFEVKYEFINVPKPNMSRFYNSANTSYQISYTGIIIERSEL